jgi:tetratricopeptide (TPR) repeat protein
MGSRVKKAAGRSAAGGEEIDRLIASRRYADALQKARTVFRKSVQPADRARLERCYRLRLDELVSQGLVDRALEVVDEYLQFGVTAAGYAPRLVYLLVRLGRETEAEALARRFEDERGEARLAAIRADLAVLDAGATGTRAPEPPAEAAQVQLALQRILAGKAEEGIELLRGLPRSSPYAEWKMFARGLAALLRDDQAAAQANWSRLDPDRAAWRIKTNLERYLGLESAPLPDQVVIKFESQGMGQAVAVSAELSRARAHTARGEWTELLARLPAMVGMLRSIEPSLAERLTRLLLPRLVESAKQLDRDQAVWLVERFIAAAAPLEIDPAWNRLRAMLWDGPHANLLGRLAYWGFYLEDLDRCQILDPATRELARAMLLGRIAQICYEECQIARALEFAEQAVALAPRYRSPHELILKIQGALGSYPSYIQAARRLLAVDPDDATLLVKMAMFARVYGEFDQALEWLERARKLRPLDQELADLEADLQKSRRARRCGAGLGGRGKADDARGSG